LLYLVVLVFLEISFRFPIGYLVAVFKASLVRKTIIYFS
jgi:hypothetical protein